MSSDDMLGNGSLPDIARLNQTTGSLEKLEILMDAIRFFYCAPLSFDPWRVLPLLWLQIV